MQETMANLLQTTSSWVMKFPLSPPVPTIVALLWQLWLQQADVTLIATNLFSTRFRSEPRQLLSLTLPRLAGQIAVKMGKKKMVPPPMKKIKKARFRKCQPQLSMSLTVAIPRVPSTA